MNGKNTLDVLFYIVNAEMARPEEEINSDLILSLTETAGELDGKYRPAAEERAGFISSVINAEKPKRRRPKKALIIIAAALALLIIAGLAVYAFTDIFSLFFSDPRELLEWEEGESRRMGDYEMIMTPEVKKYDSTDELIRDVGGGFLCPSEPPDGYETEEIAFDPSESRREIIIRYVAGAKSVGYTVQLGREHPTKDELESSGFETTETRNGNIFCIMESEVGYQGIARIGENVYIVDAADKDDVIRFINNANGL